MEVATHHPSLNVDGQPIKSFCMPCCFAQSVRYRILSRSTYVKCEEECCSVEFVNLNLRTFCKNRLTRVFRKGIGFLLTKSNNRQAIARKTTAHNTSTKINMMFHTNKKNTTTNDDTLQLAIEKATQEKDEMKSDYEKRILNLRNQANDARVVMQDMVHVARLTPEAFLTLINQEAENWNVIDLKYVAATIHNRLRYLKEKQARENSGVNAVQPSTAQVLYSYVITDPNPTKKTLVHIITELHKELVPLEEQVVLFAPGHAERLEVLQRGERLRLEDVAELAPLVLVRTVGAPLGVQLQDCEGAGCYIFIFIWWQLQL